MKMAESAAWYLFGRSKGGVSINCWHCRAAFVNNNLKIDMVCPNSIRKTLCGRFDLHVHVNAFRLAVD